MCAVTRRGALNVKITLVLPNILPIEHVDGTVPIPGAQSLFQMEGKSKLTGRTRLGSRQNTRFSLLISRYWMPRCDNRSDLFVTTQWCINVLTNRIEIPGAELVPAGPRKHPIVRRDLICDCAVELLHYHHDQFLKLPGNLRHVIGVSVVVSEKM